MTLNHVCQAFSYVGVYVFVCVPGCGMGENKPTHLTKVNDALLLEVHTRVILSTNMKL